MILEIEPQRRLVGSDRAGEILANLLGLQNGGVGGEQLDRPSGPRNRHEILSRGNPRRQYQHTPTVVHLPEITAPEHRPGHRHCCEHPWYQRSDSDTTTLSTLLW